MEMKLYSALAALSFLTFSRWLLGMNQKREDNIGYSAFAIDFSILVG